MTIGNKAMTIRKSVLIGAGLALALGIATASVFGVDETNAPLWVSGLCFILTLPNLFQKQSGS